MLLTPYYGLKKPEGTDTVNIADLNSNADAIDVQLNNLNTGKAPLASPTFTGVPAAPTAAAGTNTTQVATTAFVVSAISSSNAATATKLATARTISLTGDVTGSVNFDGSGNAAIAATVGDDSHNHSISTVTGLQSALDAKAAQTSLINTNYTVSQLTNDNLIINGDFQVWQRGTSFTVNNGVHYTADRWLMWNGSGNTTITNNFWNLAWTTGGNDNLIQVVEMPARVIGKDLTFSCLINVPTGQSLTIHCAGCTNATTSDTGVSRVYTGIGAWDNISVSVPASANQRGLFMVQFACGCAAGTQIGVTNCKLEVGTVATPFASRTYPQELALCQRYYETGRSAVAVHGCIGNFSVDIPYKVTKRTTPTVTTKIQAMTGLSSSFVVGGSVNTWMNNQDAYIGFVTSSGSANSSQVDFSWTSEIEIY